MRVRRLAVLVFALALGSCRPPASPEQWDANVRRFLDGYFRANPTFAVYQGRHEYDGKFPDWSVRGIEREIARLHTELDRATAFDTTSLDEGRRFQRTYLLAVIDRDLFWLDEARWPLRNPAYYGDLLDPNVYVTRPYAPLPERMRALTTWATNIPAALAQIRTTLRTPMPRPYVNIGHIRFGGVASYLEHDVPRVFASVQDSALKAGLGRALVAAAGAFRTMDAWFDTLAATATDSFAMGSGLYRRMLWMTERVDVPLDTLEAIGRTDLERNLGALREACATFARHATPVQCMDRMSAHKPSGSAVEAAREQLDGLEGFIREKDLVTIPGTERAQVMESPPYQRWNFAYIDVPGPYERGLPSVYYIAPPDSSWSPEERAAYVPGVADILFTSAHEVWPGHFLQFLHANRSPDLFGRVFVGYAFAEGWAHYGEEMMWEAGLGNGAAETHIGQISNALLRDARFLSSLGMHTRGMTLAQSEALFRDEALQDGATARQQAARGTFDPAYLNYTLGKLMIRQLREDWTASHGGREGWKQFHDRFLSYGGPPIPLVRRAMLGPQAGAALRVPTP